MGAIINALSKIAGRYLDEYVKDYRDVSARLYELSVKTNAQINQIVLTVSVASLTAVAALNERVFVPYGSLSFIVIALFVAVILLSVVNLYLSSLTLADAQRQLNKNLTSFKSSKTDMENLRFIKTQKILNTVVFGTFCVGLVALLALLGFYILGDRV